MRHATDIYHATCFGCLHESHIACHMFLVFTRLYMLHDTWFWCLHDNTSCMQRVFRVNIKNMLHGTNLLHARCLIACKMSHDTCHATCVSCKHQNMLHGTTLLHARCLIACKMSHVACHATYVPCKLT